METLTFTITLTLHASEKLRYVNVSIRMDGTCQIRGRADFTNPLALIVT